MLRSIPNLLSLLRLAAVPFVLAWVAAGEYERGLILAFLAGLTDAFDGYLARRLGAESRTGAYLDPLGDKFLLSGLFLVLGWTGVIPWWITVVVFARDALILLAALGALAFTRVRSFPPSRWGKLSTIVQVVTVVMVLFAHTPMGAFAAPLIPLLLAATVAATVWSAIHYAWLARRIFA